MESIEHARHQTTRAMRRIERISGRGEPGTLERSQIKAKRVVRVERCGRAAHYSAATRGP